MDILDRINGRELPVHVKELIASLYGVVFEEGDFFSSSEVASFNDEIKQDSSMSSGIFVGADGGGRYLLVDCAPNEDCVLYILGNGDQGNPSYYKKICDIDEITSQKSIIEALQLFYFNENEQDATIVTQNEVTLEFIGLLPNGLKDLVVIKKTLNLSNSISELKSAYDNMNKLVLGENAGKVKVLLRGLPPEIQGKLSVK